MRKIFCALFIALIPGLCIAGQGMGPGPGAKSYSGGGGGCATQSVAIQQTSYNDRTNALYVDGYCHGQTITPASTITVYSIIVRCHTYNGGTPTLTLRIGTGADLATYIAQATAVCSAVGEVEFIFDSGARPTLTASTEYLFGVRSNGAFINLVELSDNSAGGYAAGYEVRSGEGTNDWAIIVAPGGGTYDFYFKIKKCD